MKKESIIFPGYYVIPGNDRIVIKPDGECLSTNTGKVLNKYINNGWYPRIIATVKGNNKSFLLHRLMAFAFLDKPENLVEYDFDELHVNHKDGVKTNYGLDNLEWCLPQHNVKHAFSNFLQSGTVVLARHILLDTIIKFPGIIPCADYFKISNRRLKRHLYTNQAGIITKDWYVFKLDDGNEWPELSTNDAVEDKWRFFSVAVARNIDNGQIVLANTLEELCSIIGVAYSSMSAHKLKYGTDIPYKGWVSEITDTIAGLDTSGIILRTIRGKTNFGKPIKVLNTKTNNEEVFQSAYEFSRSIGFSGNSINNAITTNEGNFKHYKITRL